MKVVIPLIVFLLALLPAVQGQDTKPNEGRMLLERRVIDGDTVLLSRIQPVYIFKKPKFKNKKQYQRYQKLVRNVKRVYPYAKMAGEKYRVVEKEYLTLDNEWERRKYIKQIEKEILNEYEDELKKLTITQGRILLKLIDREVGETSYELLKELHGSFNAVFWQTLARIFGHNLKSEFDPQGEDKLLNDIVLMIEAGVL